MSCCVLWILVDVIHSNVPISDAVNLHVIFDTDYALKPISGKLHMVLQNATCAVRSGRTYIHLTNLFNGNEVLGKFSTVTWSRDNAAWGEICLCLCLGLIYFLGFCFRQCSSWMISERCRKTTAWKDCIKPKVSVIMASNLAENRKGYVPKQIPVKRQSFKILGLLGKWLPVSC